MFGFDVNNNAHCVAELEVLAALMRARTLKAQWSGEE